MNRLKAILLVFASWYMAAPAMAQSPTITIGVFGPSSIANTAAYGTIIDSLLASSSGNRVPGVTWSVSNPNFFIDHGGYLHTAWQSIIPPGPQTMTISAAAPGYTTATIPLTITVTGTVAPQTMLITPAQTHTIYDNSPQGTIGYSLTVSQTDGTLGNLSSGVTWTSDNPLFVVVNTMANSGIYYLITTWAAPITAGPQTVNLTASAPGYTTANVRLTVPVVASASPTMTIAVNGASAVASNSVAGTVVDGLAATTSGGAAVPGVTFAVNNVNFAVSGTNLVTAWPSPIPQGSQTMTITASAPGYTTATLPLTVTINAPCH